MDRTDPGPRWPSYWSVPMNSPGELCEGDAVVRLIGAGLERQAAEAALCGAEGDQ